MVAGTLLKTFGQCRAFHDLIQSPTKEQLENDFMNIVSLDDLIYSACFHYT